MDPESTDGQTLTPPERLELALFVELLRHRWQQRRAVAFAVKHAGADMENLQRVAREMIAASQALDLGIKQLSEWIAAAASGPDSPDLEMHEWVGISREEYEAAVVHVLLAAGQAEDA